jgi:hypothetical protein
MLAWLALGAEAADDDVERRVVAALRDGHCAEATDLLDDALLTSPDWAEGYYLRVPARLCAAGPLVRPDVVASPRRGVDPGPATVALTAAIDDLDRYVALSPTAPDRPRMEDAANGLRRRLETVAAGSTLVASWSAVPTADAHGLACVADHVRMEGLLADADSARAASDNVHRRATGRLDLALGFAGATAGLMFAGVVSDRRIEAGGFATATAIRGQATRGLLLDVAASSTGAFAAGFGLSGTIGALRHRAPRPGPQAPEVEDCPS